MIKIFVPQTIAEFDKVLEVTLFCPFSSTMSFLIPLLTPSRRVSLRSKSQSVFLSFMYPCIRNTVLLDVSK